MKLLIQVMALLLLVSSCDKATSEPVPAEQTQAVEQTQQAEQAKHKAPGTQANQVEGQESESQPEETPYQRAIRDKIRRSSKTKDSSDEKDSNDEKDG